MSGPLEDLQASTENRVMFLTTPLEDTFLLHKVVAREAISELFHVRAELYSPNPEIDFDKIIGGNVSLRIETPGGGGRFFNGVVTNFTQGDTLGALTEYAMEFAPWFWFLDQTQNCRIFPNLDMPEMSVRDILRSVFSGYDGFEFDLQFDQERPIAYCVQYLESDFAFCSRIMEENGLGYYFVHEEKSHKLVVFDQASTPPNCPTHEAVRYQPTKTGPDDGADSDVIKSFRVSQDFHAGTFTTSDFNPEDPGDHKQPGASLLATSCVSNTAGGKDRFEVFFYPGRFEFLQDGEELTKQLACVTEQDARTISLNSECAGFTSGHKFEMREHPRSDYNGQFLITGILHTISQPIGVGGMEDPIEYSNETTCVQLLSNRIPYVPREKTPKPIITGVQVATVVSPDGKGLDLDEQGRVLVKFPWDREANTTSCRLRISQVQAGSKWGSLSAPHVGQEVLVGYEGGDPDRPIIVGRVYNAANLPQLDPEKMTKTTLTNHGGVLFELEGGPVAGEQ